MKCTTNLSKEDGTSTEVSSKEVYVHLSIKYCLYHWQDSITLLWKLCKYKLGMPMTDMHTCQHLKMSMGEIARELLRQLRTGQRDLCRRILGIVIAMKL